MNGINMDSMSLEELRELRAQVDRAIAGFTERKRREAVAAAEEVIRQHGFASLAEVTRRGRGGRGAAAGRAGKGSVAARYANPEDASQTWSGRGRRPAWVNEQIGAGRSLEDMAI